MSVEVIDPFGAALDQEIQGLALALDPERARKEFKRRLPRLSGEGKLRLKSIRVVRHKPGRRCVVEYVAEVNRPEEDPRLVTLIGKVRARRSGNEGFRTQAAFWSAGFDSDSADGVSVPEPVGVIPALHMWFQRKVPGTTAEPFLAGPDGPRLAVQIAAAIHKVHTADVPAAKRHGMDAELRILRECLAMVAHEKPDWAARLDRLMRGCECLAASVPDSLPCGIHRDFYASQIIVDGPRLWLLDFDLYCQGDPSLDVGNFLGHLTEQALRERGDAKALAAVERALEQRFIELAGEVTRPAIRAYATLTLARHIFLSTRLPERGHLTEKLIALCESRLALNKPRLRVNPLLPRGAHTAPIVG